MMKKLSLCLAVAAITGCSANSSFDVADIEELKEQQIENRNEAIEEHLDQLPEWVLQPPQPDAHGMYAVGTAESNNLQTAINRARLEAEFGLAKMYGQEISGSERTYSTDSDSFANSRYVELIDKLIAEVPIVGFSVEAQEIQPVNGKYGVFVLVKLPYDEFNKVLQAQRDRVKAVEMKKEFDELERRIEKRRADLMRLQQADAGPLDESEG